MYRNTSAVVGVGRVLLSGSFYVCSTVECILCTENVYTAHCMKQCFVPDEDICGQNVVQLQSTVLREVVKLKCH